MCPTDQSRTPLGAVLVLSGLSSFGTGVFWHGIPFIAKHAYGFDETRNLLLYMVMGAVYAAGAFGAGRMTRRAACWVTPRGILALVLVAQAIVSLVPVVVERQWALWVTVAVVQFLSAILWPLVESYVTSGCHGAQMRRAIGWFNLVWAPCVMLPMFAMAPILEHHAVWAIGGFAFTNVAALAVLARFRRHPGHHDPALADAHVTPEYPFLLRSARVLLPLSYVLSSAMNPILPYRLEDLGVNVAWETPATATWMAVRSVVFVVMWRAAFWHGRWGTLLAGAVSMMLGFALVVLGPALWLVLAGFAVLGIGIGIVYYAALYYAMSVGRAAVDAGGTHEGLIGAGYGVGPAAGLLGAPAGGPGIVAVVATLVLLAGIPALLPYLKARRRAE